MVTSDAALSTNNCKIVPHDSRSGQGTSKLLSTTGYDVVTSPVAQGSTVNKHSAYSIHIFLARSYHVGTAIINCIDCKSKRCDVSHQCVAADRL